MAIHLSLFARISFAVLSTHLPSCEAVQLHHKFHLSPLFSEHPTFAPISRGYPQINIEQAAGPPPLHTAASRHLPDLLACAAMSSRQRGFPSSTVLATGCRLCCATKVAQIAPLPCWQPAGSVAMSLRCGEAGGAGSRRWKTSCAARRKMSARSSGIRLREAIANRLRDDRKQHGSVLGQRERERQQLRVERMTTQQQKTQERLHDGKPQD